MDASKAWAVFEGPEEGSFQIATGPTEGAAWANAQEALVQHDNTAATPIVRRPRKP